MYAGVGHEIRVGLAIGGPLADALGVRTLFVLGGVGCLVMGVVWAFVPTILYLEDHPGRQAKEGQLPVVNNHLAKPE